MLPTQPPKLLASVRELLGGEEKWRRAEQASRQASDLRWKLWWFRGGCRVNRVEPWRGEAGEDAGHGQGKGAGVWDRGAEGIGPRNTAPLYRTRGHGPVAAGHVRPAAARTACQIATGRCDHGHPFRGAPSRSSPVPADRPSPVRHTVLHPSD